MQTFRTTTRRALVVAVLALGGLLMLGGGSAAGDGLLKPPQPCGGTRRGDIGEMQMERLPWNVHVLRADLSRDRPVAIAGFYVADQCVEVHRRLAREDADACERARLYVELRADERALALEALEEALSLRAANEDRAGCALGRRHWQLRVVWLQVKPWAQCEPVLQRPRQLVPFWHLYLPQVIFISVH